MSACANDHAAVSRRAVPVKCVWVGEAMRQCDNKAVRRQMCIHGGLFSTMNSQIENYLI